MSRRKFHFGRPDIAKVTPERDMHIADIRDSAEELLQTMGKASSLADSCRMQKAVLALEESIMWMEKSIRGF